jgi:tripartite ATP-independent transporter DctP family solute receptor
MFAASSATLAGCERAVGSRRLTATDTHPDGYPTVEAVKYLGKRLEERTNGRLRVKTYPGGQLGEEKDALEITVFGGLDFNRLNLAPLASVASIMAVPTLPFMFRSIAHMRAAMDGAPGRLLLDALEPHGLKGLCFYDSGARSFYNTKRPIRTPEDMAGLKIRVQTSDVFVALVSALGGNATPMSYGEVYQALVQGVVDGAENNWPSFESSRHFEAVKYYSLTRHVIAPEVLIMSMRTWRSLSDEDRRQVRAAADESVPFMRELWDERVSASRNRIMTQSDIEVIEDIDHDAFVAAVRPVWEQFLTTPTERALAADIQAVQDGS